MAAKCRKFVPNIFNKTKCQNCFGAKEIHSAEALQNNKASRKVAKCGYLFVAPDFDFNSPLDRSRRWQRRFFVLYDDGTLCYSVDENPDTVPQGEIDMNKCTDVFDAETQTSHTFSVGITVPGSSTTPKTWYIKGNSREESTWWQDVLEKFPRSNVKPKTRRFPIYSGNNKENVQPSPKNSPPPQTVSSDNKKTQEKKISDTKKPGRGDIEKTKSKSDIPTFSTYKSVRSMKHKNDVQHQEGLRKSSSLQDLTDEKNASTNLISSQYLSRSGDRLNYIGRVDSGASYPDAIKILRGSRYINPYSNLPRQTWAAFAKNTQSSLLSQSSTSVSSDSSGRRGSYDEKKNLKSQASKAHRERSTSLKEFPVQFSLPKSDCRSAGIEIDRLSTNSSQSDLSSRHEEAMSTDEADSFLYQSRNNETDELKMAKSSEMQAASNKTFAGASVKESSPPMKYDDLMYMKKGWLIKQGTGDKVWKKHWFVLAGNGLCYYKDAKAEESSAPEGRIDLTLCLEINEVEVPRNYGFKIKTQNGEYILSAMTSGIRNNWMKAVKLCLELQKKGSISSPGHSSSVSPSRSIDDASMSLSSNGKPDDVDARFQQLLSVSDGETRRKEMKNTRRHHSDVGPSNINSMFTVKEFSDNIDSDKPGSSVSARKPVSNAESLDLHRTSKKPKRHSAQETEYTWSSSNLPLQRYVEGSDDASLSSQQSDASSHRQGSFSEGSKDEDKKDLLKKSKSPSARIKDKSRAKSPKLHSPPPELENTHLPKTYDSSSAMDASLTVDSDSESYEEVVETTEYVLPQGMYAESQTSSRAGKKTDTMPSKDGALVDMLESELPQGNVEADTHGSLVQPQHNPVDINAQIQSVKKQLRDAKELIQRQKSEIDSMKSKLDVSGAKEKALSEALGDLKVEKEKFLKLTSEWNRRIRNLESQLKDTTHKLEQNRDVLFNKEKECKRLENEIKTNLQKIRDHEREILKLKAVEQEYKQMKVRLDSKERELSEVKTDLKGKEQKMKQIEANFEHQIEEMEQEFTHEHDDMENHIEELKERLRETSHHCTVTDQNVAEMIKDKDEIIAQLEEKLIENDRKVVDLTEELQAEVSENNDLQFSIEKLEEEKQRLKQQLEEIEKCLLEMKHKLDDADSMKASLKQKADGMNKEKEALCHKLETEKQNNVTLQQEREKLQTTVAQLHKNIADIKSKLDKFSNADRDSVVPSEVPNYSVISTEVSNVRSLLLKLRTQVDKYIAEHSTKDKVKFKSILTMVEDIEKKCENIKVFVKGEKGGSSQKHNVKVTSSSDPQLIWNEYITLKSTFDDTTEELKKIKLEMSEVHDRYGLLESKEKSLKETIHQLESNYSQQIQSMSQRLNNIFKKLEVSEIENRSTQEQRKVSAASHPTHFAQHHLELSEEIEDQLNELEKRIDDVEQVLELHTASSTEVSALKHTERDDILSSESSVSSDDEFEDEEEDDESDDEDSSMSDSNEHTEFSKSLSKNKNILPRLKDLKSQLEVTSSHIQNITSDLQTDYSSLSQSNHDKHDESFQKHMIKCEAKINSFTCKLDKGLKRIADETDTALSGVKMDSLYKCLGEVKESLSNIIYLVHSKEISSRKIASEVSDNIRTVISYIEKFESLAGNDLQMVSKIRNLELNKHFQLEKIMSSSTLSKEDKIQLYAERLSLEAIILSEMSYLVQNNLIGLVNRDVILREIEDANQQMVVLLNMLEKGDTVSTDSQLKVDSVSTYAEVLAERILLEGHLVCLNKGVDTIENKKSDIACYAVEAFLRLQIDSLFEKKTKFTDAGNMLSSHLIAAAGIQGEITDALGKLRSIFKRHINNCNINDLLLKERTFSMEQLQAREITILKTVENFKNQSLFELCVFLVKNSNDESAIDLDSVCEMISNVLQEHIIFYGKKVAESDSDVCNKYMMIADSLRSELDSVLASLKKEYANMSERKTNLKTDTHLTASSVPSSVANFSDIICQRGILCGQLKYTKQLNNSLPQDLSDQIKNILEENGSGNPCPNNLLSAFFLNESNVKKNHAAELRKHITQLKDKPVETEHLLDYITSIPVLETLDEHLLPFAENLVREAVFQSQMAFMIFKMGLQHEDELKQEKASISGPRIELLESMKESDLEVNSMLTAFEDILENEFEDECEVINILEKEVDVLKSASVNRDCDSCVKHQRDVQNLEKALNHEFDICQEKHEIHMDVMKQQANSVGIKIDKLLEEAEKDKENIVSEYEERISQLQDELDIVRDEHEEELEQVKQDIMTAVSAIRANEDFSESHFGEQMRQLQRQILSYKQTFKTLVSEMKTSPGSSEKIDDISRSLEVKLNEMEASCIIQDDVTDSSTSPLKPESVSQSVEKTTETDNKSSEKDLELSHHEQELELLKKEKDDALDQEMRNTKAALDAMRKAYEEDLEEEKEKFRSALKTMYTDDYVEEIRRHHDLEVTKLSDELKQVQLHYSSKCEDYKLVDDRLQRTKQDYETHINQLMSSNEHLNTLLNQEIEKLKEFIESKTRARSTGNSTLEEELYDMQIMIRVKDAELQKLRFQVRNIENNLERTTEEQRQSMTQYFTLMGKHKEMETKYTKEIADLKERLKPYELARADPPRRQIRRTPSFHQRARSPSPQPVSAPKKDVEHHSRDTHRRRHLGPKDLRRSKSSPSLPFVFDSNSKQNALDVSKTSKLSGYPVKSPKSARPPRPSLT